MMLLATCIFAALIAHNNEWELRVPVLDSAPAAGFHGRHVPLERVTAANAVGDESAKTWKATCWRNERVNGQFVVWTDQPLKQLRLETSDLVSESGRISASAINARFVRFVRAELTKGTNVIVREQFVGDALFPAESTDTGRLDLPKNGFRPIWLSVSVPDYIPAGLYRGEFSVRAYGNRKLTFPIELTVQNATLAAPKDWHFLLDLWQHPWAVARYYHVPPFSLAHLDRMRPLLRELASAGQKTITTTITDLPWNHQNFDAYRTMVEHIRNPDGSWKQDYTIFDQWVRFAESCGLGPQIHCYTMASWGNVVYYVDGATGDKVSVKLVAGTKEHEEFWRGFLVDFREHLRANGWLDRTYISLDERSPEELRASVECVRKYAPELKVAMAGNRNPSEFKGIQIASYSSAIHHADDAFYAEIAERARQGFHTTFYICCGPAKPNTFMHSPLAESRWLGLFAAAKGYDGMLRWAAFNWPNDPCHDSCFPGFAGSWKPGDTYLLYPEGMTSARWEMLRDSIENYEKIRQLRAAGKSTPELDAALAAMKFDKHNHASRTAAEWAADADRVENAIHAASAR